MIEIKTHNKYPCYNICLFLVIQYLFFRLTDLEFVQEENVILTYPAVAVDALIDGDNFIQAALYVTINEDNALCTAAYSESVSRRRRREVIGK